MFAKDTRTENLLTKLGVEWEWRDDLLFADLAPGWDGPNYGRVSVRSRMEDVILEYAHLMELGSLAPGGIYHLTLKGLTILDGVQRTAASQLRNEQKFSGYLIRTDSHRVLVTIRLLANHLLAGHPEPVEWTRDQAIEVLVNDQGMTLEELSDLTGWSVASLGKTKQQLDWGFALRATGGPESLPKGMLNHMAQVGRLYDVTKAPKPIAAFANILKDMKISNGDSIPLINDFFAPIKSNQRGDLHKVYTKRLEEIKSRPEVDEFLHGKKRVPRGNEAKILGVLKAADTVIGSLLQNKASIPNLDQCFQILNRIQKNLDGLRTERRKQWHGTKILA